MDPLAHQIRITYCAECGLGPGAEQIQRLIQQRFDIQAELREGELGIFEVALNGRVLYNNFAHGGELPQPALLLESIAELIAPGVSLPPDQNAEALLVEGAACPLPARNSAKRPQILSVYQPQGFPPAVTPVAMAPRPSSLEGKTVYLVDMHFNDGDRLLEQMQAWFREYMPQVNTVMATKRGVYLEDDPELFTQIKNNGDAAILAIGH